MSQEDLMVIEFVEVVGDLEILKYAFFNRNKISEDEVKKMLMDGSADNSEYIAIMTRAQYENIFT